MPTSDEETIHHKLAVTNLRLSDSEATLAALNAENQAAAVMKGDRRARTLTTIRQKISAAARHKQTLLQDRDDCMRQLRALDHPECNQARRLPGTLNFRSPLRRTISLILTRTPDASDLKIVRDLDEDGGVELPEALRDGKNRSFESAYRETQPKKSLERTISKVRAAMRRKGLLAGKRNA